MAAALTVIVASQLGTTCFFNSYCNWWSFGVGFFKRIFDSNEQRFYKKQEKNLKSIKRIRFMQEELDKLEVN